MFLRIRLSKSIFQLRCWRQIIELLLSTRRCQSNLCMNNKIWHFRFDQSVAKRMILLHSWAGVTWHDAWPAKISRRIGKANHHHDEEKDKKGILLWSQYTRYIYIYMYICIYNSMFRKIILAFCLEWFIKNFFFRTFSLKVFFYVIKEYIFEGYL